jgi:protein-S-isoprenylcysteine O-methyltransferase Ste14
MSDPSLHIVIPTLWLAWLAYWWVSSRNVKPDRWRERFRWQLVHRVPLSVAAVLLALPRWLPRVLRIRFVPAAAWPSALGAVLVAAGLGFAVWARRHLGRNWSGSVVVKEGHSLIRTGPYRRLRHPIYSGILLALLGTGVAMGEWRGLLATVFAVASFALKARVEEIRMREIFPEYEEYQRASSALIPFVY